MSRLFDAVAKSRAESAEQRAEFSEELMVDAVSEAQDPLKLTRHIEVSDRALKRNRVVAFDKNEPEAEAFAILRTKLLHQMRLNNWNSIGITAPHEGAGKSLIAVNLAYSLLLEGNQNILLVDLDLRRPSLHKYFDFTPELGLVDTVRNGADLSDVLVSPQGSKLTLLPSKERTLHSSETLALPKMAELMDEMRSRYSDRIIIFDMPPCLVTDDVMVALPHVDCSLLVAEDGKTQEEELEHAYSMLADQGFMGVVLNKADESRKLYVY